MIKKKETEVEKKQTASDLPWPDLASELATTGDIEGLQQLLEATEDKKFNNKLDRRGKNAFIIACEEGRVEMIKMLLILPKVLSS
jgi:ankyrin repeat protein